MTRRHNEAVTRLRIEVRPGGRSTDLVRLPSLQTKDGLPREAVEAAREAIAHGRKVEIVAAWKPAVGAIVAVVGIGLGLIGLIALGQSIEIGISLVVISLTMIIGGAKSENGASASRLQGRRVAGKGRISTELWQQALQDVESGSRSEEELPAIHELLIEVANAEDEVNRLVAREKYELDQSRADVARTELAVRVAQARSLLGLAPLDREPETPPHLLNRWAESAHLPSTEPINPDELR